MTIIKEIHPLKECLRSLCEPIGFVPTMGALHQGHLSLLNKSTRENKTTILSIYLNPTQFDNKEDLKSYPSSLEDDLKMAKENDVDVVFLPTFKELYPDNYNFKIVEKELSDFLCGAHRPGHFDGVLTVVMKLLNIIRPQRVYFGEKDYQQYLLIKNMVSAFFINTEVISSPTVRDPNGLAMSSRNKKLSPSELETASHLFKILKKSSNEEEAKNKLSEAGLNVEYVKKMYNRLFAAVYLKKVRLIDNVKH